MAPGEPDLEVPVGGPTAEILLFGATSMVGSHFVESTGAPVAAAGRIDPNTRGIQVERFDAVDLSRPHEVAEYVRSTSEPVIVNFAARTDVDGIERERPPSGTPEGGPAWLVNALSPGAMAAAAGPSRRYLVHISTDFVFDGREGPYAESAARSPLSRELSWYGWTKSEGERRVLEAHPGSAIVRIAYPYRAHFPGKVDFARRIVDSWRRGGLSPLFSDQQITPTWVPDVSATVTELIRRRQAGVFHVASPTMTTPLEFGTELLRQVEGKVPRLKSGLLTTSLEESGRAPRPLRGGLRTDRLSDFGLVPTTWKDGIARLVAAEGWAK